MRKEDEAEECEKDAEGNCIQTKNDESLRKKRKDDDSDSDRKKEEIKERKMIQIVIEKKEEIKERMMIQIVIEKKDPEKLERTKEELIDFYLTII